MSNRPIQPGDTLTTWFSDRDDGMSTVLEVLPYTGRYREFFNCVLVLSAPRTRARQLQMAYDDPARRAMH